MKVTELWEMAKRIESEREDEHKYIVGVRFENKERVIGEICENSKHNTDRDDERQFPEYGTPEFDEMFEFDGASAWSTSQSVESDKDVSKYYTTDHCYLVAGRYTTNHDDGLDDGEIVIEDAEVIAIVF